MAHDISGSEGTAAELESLRPYLDLAREIRLEVDRLVGDDHIGAGELAAAIDALPAGERARVTLEAFAHLDAERQWEIIEATFGDHEVSAYLAEKREARRAEAGRDTEARAVARTARSQRRLDTGALPAGHQLSLGLFRSQDVQAGLDRGPASQVCARLLVLRTTYDLGHLQVMEDVFNPGHGLFVTADYDQAVWQRERLAGHQRIRVGSLVEDAGNSRLEPAVYPGGRVDVDVDGHIRSGTLLLGFATIGDEDVFTAPN